MLGFCWRIPTYVGLSVLLTLGACGGEGSETEESTSESGEGSSGSTTSSTGTSETSGSDAESSSAGGDGDASSGGDGDGDTTSTSGDGDSTSTGGDGDTGGMSDECVTDEDCTLFSDCCYCQALAPGEVGPDDCPAQDCFVDTCTSIGVSQAVCDGGVCVIEEYTNCDDSNVLCLIPTPQCEPGQLPELDETGSCWTGNCVEALACNAVANCNVCPEDTVCVVYETLLGNEITCDPIPPSCGQADCACAGSYHCEAPYDVCVEGAGDNDITCTCPNC